MKQGLIAVNVFVGCMMMACGAVAQEAGDARNPAAQAPARLPVREVTIFKDGHALVRREGALPTDASGGVTIDTLPSPVLGTFWPYVAEKDVTLQGVRAGKRPVSLERTALSIREMIEANPGAEVRLTLKPFGSMSEASELSGTLAGIPARGVAELEATSPEDAAPQLPQKSDFVLLRSGGQTRMIEMSRIAGLTFMNEPKTKGSSEELREALTLRLDWGKRAPAKSAAVGVSYLQKGLRWIPNYRVELDGAGKATIRLQATLVNELADLNDVTARLVVGVPTIPFKDLTDPIALGKTMALTFSQTRPNSGMGGIDSNFANNSFSNAIQSQAPMFINGASSMRTGGSGAAGPASLGPEIPSAGKAEDLFVFTVEHVTLRKGEVAALPVAEFALTYEDIYVLDIPLAPPREHAQNYSGEQQRLLAQMLAQPKVKHKIRLKNAGPWPLTTAPALLLRGGEMLAQALMTYAAPGASCDLELGTAIDIAVKDENSEVRRTPNAVHWNNDPLARIELAGKVGLTSFKKAPVKVEVYRNVLGKADSAGQGGAITMLDVLGDDPRPDWWGWYSWPVWWSSFNGMGKITWSATLEPGKRVELDYAWQYYWR